MKSIVASASAMTAVLAVIVPMSAGATTPGRTEFEILMNGSPVGSHSVTVTNAGATTSATIAISMRGRVGPVRFSYNHRCRETWRGDVLESASCNDTLNDEVKSVEITRSGANLSIRGPAFTGTAPGTTLVSSWWRAATPSSSRLINSTNGKVETVRATNAGAQTVVTGAGERVQATKWRLRGGVSNDVWYDNAGRWVKTAFRFAGQSFEYRKRTTLAGAPRA